MWQRAQDHCYLEPAAQSFTRPHHCHLMQHQRYVYTYLKLNRAEAKIRPATNSVRRVIRLGSLMESIDCLAAHDSADTDEEFQAPHMRRKKDKLLSSAMTASHIRVFQELGVHPRNELRSDAELCLLAWPHPMGTVESAEKHSSKRSRKFGILGSDQQTIASPFEIVTSILRT